MKIVVRRATAHDIEWLMTRLQKLSLFGLTKKKLFDDSDYTRGALLNLIERHIVFVAMQTHDEIAGANCRCYDGDHGLVGFIGGYFVGHPFNPTVSMLSELFWWVDEEHRGRGAGAKLVHEFVAYGKQNADWIVFGLSMNTPVKESSILKLGFKKSETSYLLETK